MKLSRGCLIVIALCGCAGEAAPYPIMNSGQDAVIVDQNGRSHVFTTYVGSKGLFLAVGTRVAVVDDLWKEMESQRPEHVGDRIVVVNIKDGAEAGKTARVFRFNLKPSEK